MVVSPLSTSALSSLETMLNSLMERSEGGDETPRDDDTSESPPPPPLPARPTSRGRRPPLPRVAGVGAAGPWTPPSSPSPHKDDARAEVSATAELERKAVAAEARLRQKEEENVALRRQIESYHVRWLEYEIKIKSLEEAFREQMASLQMAEESPAHDRHESSESHMKMSEEASARLRQSCHRVDARRSAVSHLGAEFQRQSQALENGAAALVEPRPWQPGVPSANSIDDLKMLKSQFRAWKKDYKARLRRTKAELDRDRRRKSSCWI